MPARPLRALILGGTGTISAACARLAVSRGTEVTVFNRARSSARHLPGEVKRLTGDIRDPRSLLDAVRGRDFDVVVNFLCFSAAEALQAVEVFEGRTGHYLHISTAQLYQKPPRRVPYTESWARRNPFSAYARDKIAAEDVLNQAYTERLFPVTVVRPSHTYDEAKPPVPGDWTVIDRLATGKEIVVPGDGTSLWTLTHASDFAQGLVGLFANPSTFGESFHITSDDVYSWDEIYSLLADTFHVTARPRARAFRAHRPGRARLELGRGGAGRPSLQRAFRQFEDPPLRPQLRPVGHLPRRRLRVLQVAPGAPGGNCTRPKG